MTTNPVNNEVLLRSVAAYKRHGSYSAAARSGELSTTSDMTIRRHVELALSLGLIKEDELNSKAAQISGRAHPYKTKKLSPPRSGVKRYILTSAQNNTRLFLPFWKNLLVLQKHYDAEIMVSQFTYNKARFGEKSVKPGFAPTQDDYEDLWYAPEVKDYISNDRIELSPGFVWCGELNILPTAADPVSGLQSYTGRDSCAIPHAKIAMRSIAANKTEAAKRIYTTGTVTQRNYVQKKEGFKADFHHAYGALLVEVDSAGRHFARQINADGRGRIYDLDLKVIDGKVLSNELPCLTPGDTHIPREDQKTVKIIWGKGGLVDALKPKHVCLHDLFDFYARNHHHIRNHHKRFQIFVEGRDSVEREMKQAADFLHFVSRPYCKLHVIDSNHTAALERWLREGDYRLDEPNAVFFLEAQLEFYRAMQNNRKAFHIVEWALRRAKCPDAHFLRPDETLMIGDVQQDIHGHYGPDGARGSPKSFANMGRKINSGHGHSPGIWDGFYRAGTTSLLDMEYNVGPSSWSHSLIAQHENGKRQIITLWDEKWRA